MKPLILSAYMLLGTAALTSASRKGTEHTTEETNHCIHVTYSCGVEEDICGFSGTTQELVTMVWYLDYVLCPDW